MRFARKAWIWGLVSVGGVGGLAVGCGSTHPVAVAPSHHQHHHSHARPAQRPSDTKPKAQTPGSPKSQSSTIATVGTATGSAEASLATVAAREQVPAPNGPVIIVTKPGSTTRHWAFATVGSVQPNVNGGYILWFGRQIGTATWEWIPSDLPGALSPHLPPAISNALIWANELHRGEPYQGSLAGTPWNEVTGQVGYPEGWTVYAGYGQLDVTLWMPQMGQAGAFVGLRTQWWPSTINSGISGLMGLTEQTSTTMRQLATQHVT